MRQKLLKRDVKHQVELNTSQLRQVNVFRRIILPLRSKKLTIQGTHCINPQTFTNSQVENVMMSFSETAFLFVVRFMVNYCRTNCFAGAQLVPRSRGKNSLQFAMHGQAVSISALGPYPQGVPRDPVSRLGAVGRSFLEEEEFGTFVSKAILFIPSKWRLHKR
ncbi:hypothetical protein TNCV_1111251 [Trichonephila clavipes]|nr:hypothetical protein TNCV_1111251 [Trichonephila clavipes]